MLKPLCFTFLQVAKEQQLKVFQQNIEAVMAQIEQPDLSLYNSLIELSNQLSKLSEAKRAELFLPALRMIAQKMKPAPFLTNPAVKITKIFPEQCKMLKSHAKVPLLVQSSAGKFIIKANDSLLQDAFVEFVLKIFKTFLPKLKTYEIFPMSSQSGYIEFLEGFSSLDQIGDRAASFLEYFGQFLAPSARDVFRTTLASWSALGYLLQLKDRHNGNIMLSPDGETTHIDFGFFFQQAPGGRFSVERSPFKMSEQFFQIVGGKDSVGFEQFKLQFRRDMIKCFLLKRQLMEQFQMFLGLLAGIKNAEGIQKFGERFSEDPAECDRLVEEAVGSIGSGLYDAFQALQNDINW